MVIFWGTQSGTAKTLAKVMAREALRWNVKAVAVDLDECRLVEFPESKVAVFVIATYGEGDPPDNAIEFFNQLNQCGQLRLRYAAFGLGNRNYANYNKVIDDLDELMKRRGAKQVTETGKGDESTNSTQAAFTAWMKNVFELLGSPTHIKYFPTIEVRVNPQARPTLIYRGEPNKDHLTGHFHKLVNMNNPHKAKVTQSRQLFSSTRRCLHVEFDITGFPSQQMSYETGDHLAVWPCNSTEEVERLVQVLGIQDDIIEISEDFPSPTTRHTVLRHYLEICCVPTMETISVLSQFAPKAAKQLEELDFHEITNNHLNLGKLLQKLDPTPGAWKIPFEFLLESIPRLRPRYYSISSSAALAPKNPSITALVTRNGDFRGVTSNYLLSRHEQDGSYDLQGPRKALDGGKVYIHLRKSTFRLPKDETDIIMICAGTGIAPFRAFVMERQSRGGSGKMKLFYGCRSREEHLYRELQDMVDVIVAYSREEKVYVQHKVREKATEVSEMIRSGASVYICGSAAMARDVERALIDILGEDLTSMKKNRRLQEDVW